MTASACENPTSVERADTTTKSTHVNSNSINENEQPLPTSEQKMKLDSSDAKYDVITVDTSGEKFERQANLRRSQRLSSCSVRQRNNLTQRRQLRSRHKTLTGVPGNIANEFGEIRPYSLHSDANNSAGLGTGSSFVDSDESRSVINGHVIVSPRQNQRNAEIQTEDVKVLPLTPLQRRMKLKSSPGSSHASTEFLESPTAVPCPTVPNMDHTSTPLNGLHAKDMVRPSSLNVANNDTSTDEGRHTGESNPPTPVRNGTPISLSASPQMKASPSSPMATNVNKCQQNGKSEKKQDIALRTNSVRLQQTEDRTSSGFWSGTESTRHSSTSDITAHHAMVTDALKKELRRRSPNNPNAPHISNSAGKGSPIVNDRPWMTPSAMSSSTVSINSKLSTIERTRSATSIRSDDDRYQSANSSVISVTLTRSVTGNSSMSLSSEGTALSAAEILKKSRKAQKNPSGAYNFMNYEVDPLQNENQSVSRAIQSRRSARSSKRRGGSKKRLNGEDTISMTSMADSTLLTDTDGHSAHSGLSPNDTASLSGSIFSVDQEGYYTSMHEDCGISKTVSPSTSSAASIHEATTPDTAPPDIPTPVVVAVTAATPQKKEQVFFGEKESDTKKSPETGDDSPNYNSYNRAVRSNHSTPKSLVQRPKSQSVKVQKSPVSPALDFQSELNKRLSLRRVTTSSGSVKSPIKKEKRGAPPPPPRRNSSLSSSASPSPALSHRSFSERSSPSSPGMSSPSPTKSPTKHGVFSPIPPPVPEAAEVAYMETLPPPPTPDQLEEIARESMPSTPQLTRTKSSKTPPQKPHRTSFIGGKKVPGTKPKPNVHVTVSKDVSSASPTSPESTKEKAATPEPAKVKPYYSTASGTPSASSAAYSKTTETPTTVISNEDVTNSDVKKPTEIKSSPAVLQKGTSVKSPIRKVAAPVTSPKPMTSPKKTDVIDAASIRNKSPPAVSAKPITSPKFDGSKASPKDKNPPPVSAKPVTSLKKDDVTDEGFQEKKSREQSPSCRASLAARAAFFGSTPAPQSETEEKQGKVLPVDGNKPTPDKSPDQTARDDEESKVVVEIPTPTATSTPIKTEEHPPQEVAEVDPKPHLQPEVETPDSNDWLEKIEEFSSPNTTPPATVTTPQGTESAASKLRLSTAGKESPRQTPKYSTYENLMAAIHKSKRETLAKPAGASPPSSPGTASEVFTYRAANASTSNGNKSPGSTLERKRNGRLSSNGHLNGISRKSVGGTSRDDFKALLLQNACRGTNGAQMTAAQKLLLSKPQGNTSSLTRQRPHSFADTSSLAGARNAEEAQAAEDEGPPDTPRPMLSLSDIRSAITANSASTRQGRPNRRGSGGRSAVAELATKKGAPLSVHGKKHPPPSMSSKYNTRSRTPTRPMMSISEDSETEKSPEQGGKARSSVVEG